MRKSGAKIFSTVLSPTVACAGLAWHVPVQRFPHHSHGILKQFGEAVLVAAVGLGVAVVERVNRCRPGLASKDPAGALHLVGGNRVRVGVRALN
jgi:hypothetical protein